MDKLERIKHIHTKYHVYLGDMKNVWEEYAYLVHYIYRANTEAFELKSLFSENVHTKTKAHAGGMQNRFKQGVNTKNHFIDAIGTFENYIASLVECVYLDYPVKISGGGMDQNKLFELILKSDDKQTMIDCLIEEKIRSIFYGNPLDVFENDKCKLELSNTFKDTYKDSMLLYKDIVGRRNVLIHNAGRVDKKYLRENKNSQFIEGQKIIISEDYLRGTIGLLIGIAAVTTKCVIERIYKGDCKGKLAESKATFDRCNSRNWFSDLLK